MQENTKDKEKYNFLRPTGIETFAFIFSAGALQWLHGTTTDDDGREIGNFTLFGDLLARMALADGTSTDRLCFQSVRRSIPKNSFQPIGTWAGSAYAACWTDLKGWNS